MKLFVDGDPIDKALEEVHTHNQEILAMHRLEKELTPSSIAGLFEPEAERFEDYKDKRMKCVPVSHAWTPAGDVLIGCEQGQLIRVSATSSSRNSKKIIIYQNEFRLCKNKLIIAVILS